MQKKGHGQRVKYTSLILVLVIDVVTLVSIPMTYFFLRNQRQLMAQGLYDKIELTLQNLSSSAAEIIQPSGFFPPYIKSQDLRSISNRGAAIEEVEFVTITAGPASDSDIEYFDLDPDERELIWYTNDPMLFASNIQIHEYLRRHGLNVEGDPIQLLNVENSVLPEYYRRSTDPYVETIFWRRTRISDPLSQRIAGNEGSGESDIARMLALNANEQFSTVREDISTVFSQLLNSRSDEEIQELHSQLDVLWERQDAIVLEAVTLNSIPEYRIEEYDINFDKFLFSYPIYGYDDEFNVKYIGTVRLGVSTARINQQMRNTTRTTLIQVGISAAIAIALGFIGGLIIGKIISD